MTVTIYKFGDFLLNPAARELRRGQDELNLPLKVFQCIAYLVEHRDRAIGRDELISAVWGDAGVSDNVLGQAIRHARRAVGDSGDDQCVIKTIRGYGYRWVMAVEEASVESLSPEAASDASPRWPARRMRRWMVGTLGLLLGISVVSMLLFVLRQPDTGLPVFDEPVSSWGGGEIALLLPVVLEEDPDHAWVRLGAMDLMAERLRASGQVMVPSDTVIALLQGNAHESEPDQLNRLVEDAGVHLILAARAQVVGTRWTVSLRSLSGPEAPLNAVGEAYDVLEAARLAADRMAVALGLIPPSEPAWEPDLRRLLQQVEAARLSQQMDLARVLIESTEPELRRHPEVLFQWARIHFYSHDLEAARETLESLLEEEFHEPVLRARVLNGLAAVYASKGERARAAPMLEEAAQLLAGRKPLEISGTVHMNLGVLRQETGEVDAARVSMAQARRIFEGIGDIHRLAALDFNRGALEGRREHYAAALRYFRSAAERHAALRDVGGELLARTHMVHAHLLLLEVQAASALEPRVAELLEETVSPELVARANLSRIHLLDANGQNNAAKALLNEMLQAIEAHDDIYLPRKGGLVKRAEHALRDGDAVSAARMAADVIEALETDENGIQGNLHGFAWLVLVRAYLAQDDTAAAATVAAEMVEWAQRGDVHSATIYADLAEAEVAVAEGRSRAAERFYEHALAVAEDNHMPFHLLQVAESYVPWLLGYDEASKLERALYVADLFSEYATQYYEAAILQLHIYHALGPPSAWRTAMERATSLAGERRVPPELLVAR